MWFSEIPDVPALFYVSYWHYWWEINVDYRIRIDEHFLFIPLPP
jgi:hypothetical protein